MSRIHDEAEKRADALAAIVLLPVCMFAHAFVLSKLWLWFVAPLGVQVVGMAHACGLAVIVGMLSGSSRENDEWTPLENVGVSLLRALLGLGLGWAAHAVGGGAA